MVAVKRRMGTGPENHSREAQQARVTELGRAYADALLSADEAAAEIAIREAMDAGLGTAQIDDEIIAPALWRIGDLWERGEISVADEHIATEISIRVLALQREAQRVAQTRGEHRIVLAAPAGEQHIVALRMIDNLLRSAGYDVAMLGADVPGEDLITLMHRRPPAVVCLTSTMAGPAGEMLATIAALQRRWPAMGFVIGGSGSASRVHSWPGIDVCRRVSDAVEAVDAMVKGGSRN
jgi:MerR family transcriptional regulator, light-induced transcriptional regulator